MLVSKQKNEIVGNNLKDSKDIIQPLDPTLNLPNINMNSNQNSIKINENDSSTIKRYFAIEILQQIISDHYTSMEEKEKLSKLIQQIKDKGYTSCFSEINAVDQNPFISLDEKIEKIDPKSMILPNTLNYDIEFYKIGQRCHGLKKRSAIVKNGKFYSSDKPLNKLEEKDFTKLKEKTSLLQGAEVICEIYDEEAKDQGEWSNKDKKFRIRINYKDPEKKDEEKLSSFFFYFENKEQMDEFRAAIFNLNKTNNYKLVAHNAINDMSKNILNGNKLYTILKILSVKNKIKQRKALFNKIQRSVHYKINSNFIQEFLDPNYFQNMAIKNISLKPAIKNLYQIFPKNFFLPKKTKDKSIPDDWEDLPFNIKNKYDNGNYSWYDDSNAEWIKAFHGTGRNCSSDEEIKDMINSILQNGFKAGKNNVHEDCDDINHPGKKIGIGVYVTPNISTAKSYAGSITIKGKQYVTLFLVKVKKNAIRSCDCEYAKDYWVLRGTDEEIRPISVLLSDGTNISIGDPLLFLSYDKNQLSNFMPPITGVEPDKSNFRQQASLNKLIKQYNFLQNEIPADIIKEPNDDITEEGICYGIKEGIKVMNNSENNIDFNLQPETCVNTRYIFFDKNKPEIVFKNNNDNNNLLDQNILSENNIYEISSVIKNSNDKMDNKETNNLIILGPKLNNDKEINYQYKNKEDIFIDPESVNIKTKYINPINNKNQHGLTLQIYHSELSMNEQKIKDSLRNLTGSYKIDIDNINVKEELLFGYIIKLSALKSIESPLVKPKNYTDNICFIEYNQQYFIPREYYTSLNSEIIIETFCIPLASFSGQEQLIPENQLGCISKYLSPIKIGYSKITLKDINSGKYKYEIFKEYIPISNSFILIDGMEENIESIKIKNNIEGKDYSIGNDSYITTTINKDFIDQIKENKNISNEILNQYFNVCFDTQTESEFLLRPSENMKENDFINDISGQISKEDLNKIMLNKKFNYLPCCEKFIDRINLDKSKNLGFLSQEEKDKICNQYNKGDWIYKLPELKVRLLSKNLGILKDNNNICQMIYCINKEQAYPLDALNEDNEERIYPISENNFNIFDFKEIQNIDTDNFQWILGIKFNNSLQMNSFLKLLNIARHNINTKKKNERIHMSFEENKIIEFNEQKNIKYEKKEEEIGEHKLLNKCDICLNFIEFIDEFILDKNNNELDGKIIVKGLTEKTILPYFIDKKYSFENSIINNDIIKSKMKNYIDFDVDKEAKIIDFPEKKKIDINKFNQGEKRINFNENIVEIDFDRDQINNTTYELLINLGNNEFSTPLDMNNYLNKTKCNIIELPLYKTGDKNNKIYSLVELQIAEKEGNIHKTIIEQYYELNQKFLREPATLLKDQLSKSVNTSNILIDSPSRNNRFGLCEPNIYRRRILSLIHNLKNLNIDPCNLENYEDNDDQLKKLYNILYKECADLPSKSNFRFFKISNLRRNNDSLDLKNSYRKKLGKELLQNQRHEKFMQTLRENKWDIYLKNLSKGKNIDNPIDYFIKIPDKKYLLKNGESAENLNKLMYLGIPSEYFREAIYTNLLDLPQFYELTKELILEKEKINKDLKNPKIIFSYFVDQLYENEEQLKRNIIFSLIDNDSNIISRIDDCTLEDINIIKKIAKSFFIWAELRIGLTDKNDKYVYFIGLLTLIQQLYQYFQKDYFVFWVLVGLSNKIAHFKQKNPIFSSELNYINICGLVTRLIMECHQKKIYDKFIELNISPELFIANHLSTLFTDYFKGELMMRILDIIIFECSFQDSYSDNMQYLRVLCTIPLTLFEFSENEILCCKSVSEIEAITNDLFLHTFNRNKFIGKLGENINKFYVAANFLERWFFVNKGREWDNKRGELENLIKRHFYPIYEDNKNYLYEINQKLKTGSESIINSLFENLDNNLNSIKLLYLQGTASDDSKIGINIQITKLKQIYNNQNSDINDYILNISFGDTADKTEVKYGTTNSNLNFDSQNNEIINLKELSYSFQFNSNLFPRYIHFSISDSNNNNIRANFSYKILNYEPMKISKIILENKEEQNKYFIEFILFKYINKKIPEEELCLFNNIFSAPEYTNSIKIEEKLNSYSISNYFLNRNISNIIQNQNTEKNKLINELELAQINIEQFKKINNYVIYEDKYNMERIINRKNSNNLNRTISEKIINILELCIPADVIIIIKNWLSNSNISIEEILYSIILIDESIISINEKLNMIFKIGQMRDKLLLNTDDISIDKLKEMIYSLYKRFKIFYTKNEINRMIDFLLKDERLFNIKYAFIHSKKDTEKINEIIYDKDYYEPTIDKNKKSFEIIFDDISKELNIFLNHFSNHYDINSFSPELIFFMFKEIINKKDINKYSKYGLDTITLLTEKDNIISRRIYNIKYSPLKIHEINQQDISECKMSNEITNIEINNSYSINNYISFDRFKEIFFKLPYLSDLFRVSLSYLNQPKNINDKEFNSFKIIIGDGIFYFPNKTEIEENDIINTKEYDINYKVKISDTVDKLINKIINKINMENSNKFRNKGQSIIDSLQSIYKIKCIICYDIDNKNSGRIIEENIGYFDTLYSCFALKDKDHAEIKIIINSDIFSFDVDRLPEMKEDGYCKIYYSNNDDFIWKKCKVKRGKMNEAKLTSVDYKSSPRILNKNEDVLLSYDIIINY